MKQRKITYDDRWKHLCKSYDQSASFSWEKSKKEILNLLNETHPKLAPEADSHFQKFLAHLKPDDALACLQAILLSSIELMPPPSNL